ncbi:phosphate acetyltransferase [Ruminococcaceae bacterium OttesenSCG-928-O06]|nr:phosphate acetyltransferase [Ruminococcaceae bacterium OttesenSCG-928-O06]
MFRKMIEMLKVNKVRLVLPEGRDHRIQQAANRLRKEGLLEPVLLGDPDEIIHLARQDGIDLSGMEMIEPRDHPDFDEIAQEYYELRKHKMTEEECRKNIKRANYFGAMLLRRKYVDCMLCGATFSTLETIRPALQIIKTKPECKVASTCFIMTRPGKDEDERYVMGDCALNISPDEDDLVEITIAAASMARLFDIEPKVALLSYSSMRSGKGESPRKMRNVVERLKEMKVDFPVDGELQFDAAFTPNVGKFKAPESPVAGEANTFIFPDLNAGNIGYKIAQRLGGFEALGPICTGMNHPINDLSRGSTTEEVYKMAIITAASVVPGL